MLKWYRVMLYIKKKKKKKKMMKLSWVKENLSVGKQNVVLPFLCSYVRNIWGFLYESKKQTLNIIFTVFKQNRFVHLYTRGCSVGDHRQWARLEWNRFFLGGVFWSECVCLCAIQYYICIWMYVCVSVCVRRRDRKRMLTRCSLQ